MKTFIVIFFSLIFFGKLVAQAPNHSLWSNLLNKYVSDNGNVNYEGFMSDKNFKTYILTLNKNHPQENWSKDEKLAYWINAYNAYTILLIIKNYPIKSIKDIKSPWDKKFINIEGKKYSLNDIEHKILRKKFNEPRIHFAIVCASYSCPKLLNKAFEAKKINEQLNAQTRDFLSDETKNVLTPNKVYLSQIFNWFKGDFTKNQSLITFINKYSMKKFIINEKAKITYKKYDWSLNK